MKRASRAKYCSSSSKNREGKYENEGTVRSAAVFQSERYLIEVEQTESLSMELLSI